MIEIRRSAERGQANHGWLQSQHTFSFAHYYDPKFMGVSALRVINDDKVIPGRGFGSHSHQDMEIISYVKKGTIEHKDSMGNIERLPAGEFQLMSAGSGVTHSEYNPSTEEGLEFLQIWIEPNVYGIDPGYQQKKFEHKQGVQLVVSPDGRDGSLSIHQDACLSHLVLDNGAEDHYEIDKGRVIYLHIIAGELKVNDETLHEGDGAALSGIDSMQLQASSQTEALMFDLP